MTIGKRLAKERDEMCRELRRLHESTLELHDKMIMEMQVGHKTKTNNDHIIQACNSLHERWQHQARQWYGNSEHEHKLWIAEESWRKSKTGSSGPSSLQDYLFPQKQSLVLL